MAAPSGLELSAATDPRFVAAHQALVRDGAIQLQFDKAPPLPQPPQWISTLGHWIEYLLTPVRRLFEWLASLMPDAPVARVLLWVVIATVVLAVIWVLAARLRGVRPWRWQKRATGAAPEAPEDDALVPDAALARDWLSEADRLASDGAFADAIHHLLKRSVEDIERRRPALVRPASTSRHLAADDAIPNTARSRFREIALLVERSLFAAKPVDAEDWAGAREAYVDFAIERSWQG